MCPEIESEGKKVFKSIEEAIAWIKEYRKDEMKNAPNDGWITVYKVHCNDEEIFDLECVVEPTLWCYLDFDDETGAEIIVYKEIEKST
jgi:hypothetical protein